MKHISVDLTVWNKRNPLNIIVMVLLSFIPSQLSIAQEPYRLPEWFDGNRVHAHTRLHIVRYADDPLFFTAGEQFGKMGVKVCTRYLKGSIEGCWWPSKVGKTLPEAEKTNLAKKIIDNAHAHGVRLIGYYRHMIDQAAEEAHPEWICRMPDGKPIHEKRHGAFLCVNSGWRDFVKVRLLEMVDMGVDGIYFDYIHMPAGMPKSKKACYCQACRRKYKEIYGQPMPTDYNQHDADSLKRIDFYNRTLIDTFSYWREAVHKRNPECMLLVSTTWTPSMFSPVMSSRFAAVADSAKTEWNKACVWPRTIPPDVLRPDDDMRWGAGFTYLRGACNDRPPHVWIYSLWTKEEALSAAAACMTYGLVANIDVKEADIPNMVFAPAYEMSRKVSPYLMQTRPIRWAAIHYNEKLRDQLWPDEERIWKEVLWPAYGPFEALCRERLPVAYVTDWQLETGKLDGYKILILPWPDKLTATQQKAVVKFESKGGVVVRVDPAMRFYNANGHDECVKEFFGKLQQGAPPAPVKVRGGPEDLHAVAWEKQDGSATTVCLLNKFLWFSLRERIIKRLSKDSGSPFSPPPPVPEVVVTLRSKRTPKKVFNAVTGIELNVRKIADGWQVKIPEFPFMAAVVYEW